MHERFQQVPGGGGGGLKPFVFMKVTEIKGILNGMKMKHRTSFSCWGREGDDPIWRCTLLN